MTDREFKPWKVNVGRKRMDEKNGESCLPFVARPLAQLIVAAAQIVALIRRQTLKAIPLFAEVFFVLRRHILPALIVALDALFFFRTETAPIVAAISCPGKPGQQQN